MQDKKNEKNIYIEKLIKIEGKSFETYSTGLIHTDEINPEEFINDDNVIAVRYAKRVFDSVNGKTHLEKLTDWIYFGQRVTFEELQKYHRNKPYYKQAHYLTKKMKLLPLCKRGEYMYLMGIFDLTFKEYNAIYTDANKLVRVLK